MFVFKYSYNQAIAELEVSEEEADTLRDENHRLRDALLYIVSQETGSANATVTRIVAKAKEALR